MRRISLSSRSVRRAFNKSAVVLATIVGLFAAHGARAGSVAVNVLINSSGTAYYQIAGGTWQSWTSGSGSWDSMVTQPNVKSGTSVGNTTNFALSSMSYTGGSNSYSVVGGWNNGNTENTADSTEAALIVSANSLASTGASSLLVLDGPGYIYDYAAPPVTGPVAGRGEYGYTTGSNLTSYNPNGGTPITEVGGLYNDMEWNTGMFGNNGVAISGTGSNILTGTYQSLAAPAGTIGAGNYLFDVFNSSALGSSNITLEVRSDIGGVISYSNVSPTVYVQVATVPLPRTVFGGAGLLGFLAVTKFIKRQRLSCAQWPA